MATRPLTKQRASVGPIDQPVAVWTVLVHCNAGVGKWLTRRFMVRPWPQPSGCSGIQYTDTERAQMLDNLADQIELAVRRRVVKLPNSLPPATVFDPRPPGFTLPAQRLMNIPRIAPAGQ